MKHVIVISDLKTNKSLLRIPQVTERSDGTLWAANNTIPIIVTRHLDDAESIKATYQKAGKKVGEIVDPAHQARLGIGGQNSEKAFRVELDRDYSERMSKQWAADAKAQKEHESNQVRIFISTRGWGDFSSLDWTGDRRTPTEQILSEMRSKIENGCDVDTNPTDQELLALIKKAKGEKEEKAKAEFERIETTLTKLNRDQLPDARGAARRRQNYINVNNEGGEGYVPHFYSREEYDHLVDQKNELIQTLKTLNA